jgi:hypothetical protein
MLKPSKLLLFASTLCAVSYGYIFYYAFGQGAGEKVILLIPLLLVLIIENRRLTGSWKEGLIYVIIALLVGLFAFLPGKNEAVYDFADHLYYWPFFFIFAYLSMSVLFENHIGVVPMGEGYTLLLNCGLIYLIFQEGWLDDMGSLHLGLGILIGLFTLYVFFHGFAKQRLSTMHRFVLSIWSCLILIVFAVYHGYNLLFKTFSLEGLSLGNWEIFLSYFLLGVALIYIYRNFIMLSVYLPAKGRTYHKEHIEMIKVNNQLHVDRYAPSQLPLGHALLIVFLSGTVYSLNAVYHYFEAHTLIMVVLWLVPLSFGVFSPIPERTVESGV